MASWLSAHSGGGAESGWLTVCVYLKRGGSPPGETAGGPAQAGPSGAGRLGGDWPGCDWLDWNWLGCDWLGWERRPSNSKPGTGP